MNEFFAALLVALLMASCGGEIQKEVKESEPLEKDIQEESSRLLNPTPFGSSLTPSPKYRGHQKALEIEKNIEAFAKKHGVPPHPLNLSPRTDGTDPMRSKRLEYYRTAIDVKVIKSLSAKVPAELKAGIDKTGRGSKATSKAVSGQSNTSKPSTAHRTGARASGWLGVGFLAWDIAQILARQGLTDEQREAVEELLDYQEMVAEQAVVENAMRIRGIVDKMLETMSPAQVRAGLQSTTTGTDNEKNHAYDYLDWLDAVPQKSANGKPVGDL